MKHNLIQQFNRFANANKSLIQKALSSATGSGEALIPENLEQIITDTIIRMSPELALVEAKKIIGKKHEFNRLTAKPTRGGAMGENATTPTTSSSTVRADVTLKIVRRKGVVTNFLKDTSEGYIDSAAFEMENHLQAHVLDLIYYMLYGNEHIHDVTNSADAQSGYEMSGLDKFIATNRINKAVGGMVPTSLAELDALIDRSNRKGGARHRRAFGMSPEMLSKFSQLLTNVRLNQGIMGNGITQVSIEGGWRLNAYRDIPIIETTAVAPIEILTSSVTSAAVATGGSLSDDTYYYRIAPVTYEGEQEASAEGSQTVAAGTAVQRVSLTLDAEHTTDSVASALSYKIYVGTATGVLTLNKIVSAFTYDSDGSPTAVANGLTANKFHIDSLTPSTDVPTHMQADVPLVSTGGIRPEIVYLWDLDPIQGLGKFPYTNTAGDQFDGLVTTRQLAEVDDYIQFLVKSYPALCDAFEATSCWVRGLRIA